jgi:type VI secretion system protein ImpI/type VI secretion system protein
MTLTISILRCPDSVPPQTRQVTGGELSIGRGPENDWVLPDPDRVLSKRHCVVAFRHGGWQIADVSSNGTYINRETDPIGPGRVQELRDGDRLRLGSYEMELHVDEAPMRAPGSFGGTGNRASPGVPLHGDPFGDDPFAATPPPRGGNPFDDDSLLRPAHAPGSGFSPAVALPSDFDPLIPSTQDSVFSGPTQADHRAAVEDAFRPPQTVTRLPDDWDLDFSTPQQAPPSPPMRAPVPTPPPAAFAAPPAPPPPPPPALSPLTDPLSIDPFEEPIAPAPVARMAPLPPAPPPQPAMAAPAMAPASAAPVPAMRASDQGGDLLGAFLRGAGLEDARPADAEAAMERLGAAFRATVAGIRHTLIARAAVKSEFRIEQTMIRARGNNPLKFSAGDDDALAALIGAGRRADMPAAEAITDALRDIRLHELASMAAMQSAVRALLQRLDPAPLREEGDRGGGLLPAQRRARAFDLFEKLHGEVTRALADDFDSVFGKAFARAYEQALREASDKENS